MTFTLHLVSSLNRMEETLISKALSKWANVVRVNPGARVFELGKEAADAAVVRSVSLYESVYTASVYESNNVFTVNNSMSLIIAGDKLLAYTAFSRAGIPIPRTLYVPASNNNPGITLEFPVVSKPPVGSWGRLVSKSRSDEEMKTILELRKNMSCATQRNILIQEYVENQGDIRCIVINEKLVGCIKRKPVNGDWRANVALGGKTSPIKPTPLLEETAVKAAKATGGYFTSIDLFETKDKEILVNEVNGVPEFKGFLKATNKNPAETLSQELKETLKK